MPALAHHLAVAYQDGTDDRVGMRRPPPRSASLQRALSVGAAAAIEPPRLGRSGAAKIALPATSRGTGRAQLGGVFLTDAAVDLDRAGHEPAQPRHASERLGHERLARVAGPDRHAEHDVGVGCLGEGGGELWRRARVERDADPARARGHAAATPTGSSDASTWNVTESPPDEAISSK